MNAPFCRGLVGALGLLGAALAWGWPTPAPLFPNYSVYYPEGAAGATPLRHLMDFDGDGDVDLLMAESGGSSGPRLSLWTNRGTGRFEFARYIPGSGTWPSEPQLADLDGDERPELVGRATNAIVIRTLRASEAPLRTTLQSGLVLRDVRCADLDGDNRPELLALAADRLRVLHNDGTGYFYDYSDCAVGRDIRACAAADFSGDGRVDLAMIDTSSATLFVWEQRLDGSFSEHAAYALSAGPWSLAAGDMNGDGIADLAIAGAASPGVVVRYATGDNDLTAPLVIADDPLSGEVVLADMDGDGDADLVGIDAAADEVRIWRSDATGVVTPIGMHHVLGLVRGQVVDVNEDGRPDVMAFFDQYALYYSPRTLLNDGNGNLQTGVLAELPLARALGVGDADGDGDTDILLAASGIPVHPGRIALHVNDGQGHFTIAFEQSMPQPFISSFEPWSASFADVDGDGDADGVITDLRDNSVWILRHVEPTWVLEPAVHLAQAFYIQGASDLDHDGDEDLFGYSYSSGLHVLWTTPGGFSPLHLPNPQRGWLEAADLNADDYQDLLASDSYYGPLTVYWNNHDGTFTATQPGALWSLYQAAAGDIDLDGDTDVLAFRRFNPQSYVLRNDGHGDFDVQSATRAPLYFDTFRCMDMDGDSYPDLIGYLPALEMDVGILRISVWLNDWHGGFRLEHYPWPRDINEKYIYRVADFNTDGLPDLLYSDGDKYKIIRNLGGGTYVCRGDVNCDGLTTFADIDPFVSVLSGGTWPHCPRANADASGDGAVTFADIDPFVALLGQDQDCDADGFADRCMIAARLVDDCDGNGVPDTCDLAAGAADCNADGVLDACEVDCNSNGIPDDCDIAAGALDCDGNRVPDACEPDCDGNGQTDVCQIGPQHHNDCNQNGRLDACDIAVGFSADCTGNGRPDECEPDCNGNGVADSCDLLSGHSGDCNTNGVPDECDIAGGSAVDCNGNGVPDACDLAAGTSPDCNHNLKPDECDLANGLGDCDNDGVLDVCDPDCNGNGRSDHCDLLVGSSFDCNGGGIPDECELQPLTTFHQLFAPLGGQSHALTLVAPPPATSPVEIGAQASGDLAYANEFITVMIDGVATGVLFEAGFQCAVITGALVVPAATWNGHIADGEVTLTFVPSAAVNPAACGGNTWLDVTVRYHYSQDLDADGALDLCYCRGDANCDGDVTFADIELFVAVLGMPATGVSATGCPVRNADANGDGLISFADIDPFVNLFGTSCH